MLKKAALAFQINWGKYLFGIEANKKLLFVSKKILCMYVSKGGWLLKLVIPMHWKNTDEI